MSTIQIASGKFSLIYKQIKTREIRHETFSNGLSNSSWQNRKERPNRSTNKGENFITLLLKMNTEICDLETTSTFEQKMSYVFAVKNEYL